MMTEKKPVKVPTAEEAAKLLKEADNEDEGKAPAKPKTAAAKPARPKVKVQPKAKGKPVKAVSKKPARPKVKSKSKAQPKAAPKKKAVKKKTAPKGKTGKKKPAKAARPKAKVKKKYTGKKRGRKSLGKKPNMVTFKMTDADMKLLSGLAKKYTKGNISAWIRHAARVHRPKKGEKILSKLR